MCLALFSNFRSVRNINKICVMNHSFSSFAKFFENSFTEILSFGKNFLPSDTHTHGDFSLRLESFRWAWNGCGRSSASQGKAFGLRYSLTQDRKGSGSNFTGHLADLSDPALS